MHHHKSGKELDVEKEESTPPEVKSLLNDFEELIPDELPQANNEGHLGKYETMC